MSFSTRSAGVVTERLRIASGGYIGIGTTSPLYPLDFENGGLAVGNHGIAWVGRTSISESGLIVGYHSNGSNADYPIVRAGGIGAAGLALAGDSNNQAAVFIKSGGNVGIGTTNPQSLLAVNGTITTKEVVVTSTGWSDYVFATDYKLRPLKEVAVYIKENHHLPEIPSADEVQEKGVSLGEMQSKLLAKIEELTLHAIHAEQRSSLLEKENREMQERNRELGERINRIEARIAPEK